MLGNADARAASQPSLATFQVIGWPADLLAHHWLASGGVRQQRLSGHIYQDIPTPQSEAEIVANKVVLGPYIMVT